MIIAKTGAAYDYPLLLKSVLTAPLRQVRDQQIVYRDLRRFTYVEFVDRVGRLANALAALSVKSGDTVGVLDWDSHRYLEAYLAIPMMGAVLFMANVRLSPEQIAYTVNHSGASVLLVNGAFLGLLEAIRPQLTSVRSVVLLNDDAGEVTSGYIAGEYESLLAAATPHYDFPNFDENTQATTFYTTGTTGTPKGVNFSHRQLVLHTLALLARFGVPPVQGRFHLEDVYMPMTPMFHVHAWGFPWAATMAGLKQVYPGRYAPDVLLNLIVSERVSFTHCVPTILQMLLDAPAGRNVDLSGLKMVIGGSALPVALAKQALERGIDIFAGYGMSETGPILTIARAAANADFAGSDADAEARSRTGYPGPLVEIRVVDPDMNNVPRDGRTAGEIVVRAPWLTQGYTHNPQASEELWAGGYLHTNDMGTVAPDGCLQITDRIKDVIKTGGEWVSSLQLESLISHTKHVVEAAVIGVTDERWGERPLAIVVRDNSATGSSTAADIRRDLEAFAERGVIARYAIPERIIFVSELPKTSVGKLDKKALREQFGGRPGSGTRR